jgi:hypothetical protein
MASSIDAETPAIFLKPWQKSRLDTIALESCPSGGKPERRPAVEPGQRHFRLVTGRLKDLGIETNGDLQKHLADGNLC